MHSGTVRHDEEPVADPLGVMVVGLARLERREREVSALRRKLHDRLDSFPNEVTRRQERDVSAERRELHRRIDELRALLAAL